MGRRVRDAAGKKPLGSELRLRYYIPARGRGGIGRRVRFRSVWGQLHEGSSPFARTMIAWDPGICAGVFFVWAWFERALGATGAGRGMPPGVPPQLPPRREKPRGVPAPRAEGRKIRPGVPMPLATSRGMPLGVPVPHTTGREIRPSVPALRAWHLEKLRGVPALLEASRIIPSGVPAQRPRGRESLPTVPDGWYSGWFFSAGLDAGRYICWDFTA